MSMQEAKEIKFKLNKIAFDLQQITQEEFKYSSDNWLLFRKTNEQVNKAIDLLAQISPFPKASCQNISRYLKRMSSICAIAGGVILASNTPISGYGFLFLFLSSGQLLIASVRDRDGEMIRFNLDILYVHLD